MQSTKKLWLSIDIWLIVLVGIICGSGIALYRITHWSDKDASIMNGSWMGQNLEQVGTSPLLTARVATAAVFALNPNEVVYMVAESDANGDELSSLHNYVIRGVPIDARYWSITYYDTDYFLIPNETDRYSYNLQNIQYEEDGSFSIHVSSKRQETNWLPASESGKFYLVLRMYHPLSKVYNHLEEIQLPIIEKVAKDE